MASDDREGEVGDGDRAFAGLSTRSELIAFAHRQGLA
jgi:hypothetical protein